MASRTPRALLVIGLGLAVTHCAANPGWTPLNGAALRVSKPRTIKIRVEQPAEMTFQMTTRAANSGLIVSEGAADRVRRGLRDPSVKLGAALGDMLAEKYSLDAGESQKVDLTLDVRTTRWGLGCTPRESKLCLIIYRVDLRLVDNRDERMLAAGTCENTPVDRSVTSSKHGFFTGTFTLDVESISESLDQASKECVETFRTKLLGIYRSSPPRGRTATEAAPAPDP